MTMAVAICFLLSCLFGAMLALCAEVADSQMMVVALHSAATLQTRMS